ncbi:MAG TPA: phenylalanine--tRNA ligase subunit alpha [Allosphingosinicella sp.]|nr:phenylalanine--tRNA ligase subunit alpha [Allosphingosinicella sp.]
MADLDRLSAELLPRISSASDLAALEGERVSALGKQGAITQLLKSLGGMTPEQRQSEGPRIHALREAVTEAIAARKAALEAEALERRLATEGLDMTLPVAPAAQGSVHPVSQVMDELAEIFADMGFSVAEGPEIEDDWHNFTALNFPPGHPARAMHDTFYLRQAHSHPGPDPGSMNTGPGGNTAASVSMDSGLRRNDEGGGEPMLLRTHTSPVQIRAMQSREPPIYIIAPGRTYRSDNDATHTPMFHQVEGLVIDRGIHLGHLKWTLETFLKAFFEREDIVLRLRPSYFPFTEPSAEVDVGFTRVKGRRVLGGTEGWMELLGSGMVHPRVIANCGLDPDEWQGFAFGCGIDRLAMLKYGMDDLRAFFDGDLRWLRHYGFAALDVPTLSGGVGA